MRNVWLRVWWPERTWIVEIPDDDQRWSAIADPTRKRLLDRLLTAGPTTATALAAELPVTRQAVAKHLVVLERAGLVTNRRAGRELHWAVRPEGVDAATRSMARAAAEWDHRLTRLRELANATTTEGEGDAAAR